MDRKNKTYGPINFIKVVFATKAMFLLRTGMRYNRMKFQSQLRLFSNWNSLIKPSNLQFEGLIGNPNYEDRKFTNLRKRQDAWVVKEHKDMKEKNKGSFHSDQQRLRRALGSEDHNSPDAMGQADDASEEATSPYILPKGPKCTYDMFRQYILKSYQPKREL